jgi:uncharacterized membrane protein
MVRQPLHATMSAAERQSNPLSTSLYSLPEETAVIPDPLHPAIVHFPMALAVLVPGLAVLGTWVIARGLLPVRTWAVVLLLQVVLVGSAWLALETGEEQEERVERVVAERYIETHEEAAERFLWLAAIALIPIGAGLTESRRGLAMRIAGSVAAVAVLGAGVYVGHSGGELVYVHGAASAYANGAPGADTAQPTGSHAEHDDD